MSARDVAVEALRIASSICIYTNDNITVESL
jgi:ATP-dependent protease HslVU (ClpYQ) peptidase subunit